MCRRRGWGGDQISRNSISSQPSKTHATTITATNGLLQLSQHHCRPTSRWNRAHPRAASRGPASRPLGPVPPPTPPPHPAQCKVKAPARRRELLHAWHTPPPGPGALGPRHGGRLDAPAPAPRSPRSLTHVPAAPAPLARALAQIPPPVARPSPQRCCCGNSIATSICQTATRGAGRPRSGGAGAPGRAGGGERPGQPRASRPPRPPPPRHRFTERDIKGENGVSGARGVLE